MNATPTDLPKTPTVEASLSPRCRQGGHRRGQAPAIQVLVAVLIGHLGRPLSGATPSTSPQGTPTAMARELPAASAVECTDKRLMSPPQRKVARDVRALAARVASFGHGREGPGEIRPGALANPFRRVDDDGMIHCYVEGAGDLRLLAEAVEARSGRVELISPLMGLVQCWLPHDRIEALAADPAVEFIRLPAYAMTRTGSVTSQGDAGHRSVEVRTTYGFSGSGRKVGIISDGIAGIGASQASGDIPPDYEAQSARGDRNLSAGAEGTAMLEIVHDLAPGAALAFANMSTSAEMIHAIDILDTTFRCNILCDDVGFADEPFFEDGPIVTRINQAVANGAVYISAAGNAGEQSYHESDYTGMTRTIGGLSMNVQDFGDGDWNIQAIVPGNGGVLVVVLQWNDPWGASGNDYDLLLTSSTGSTVYAVSDAEQTGDGRPLEIVGIQNTGVASGPVYIVVRRFSGAVRHLKIVSWGTGYLTEHTTPTGSIWGHAAALNTLACGAVRWNTPDVVESFSSRGPVRIDFPSLAYREKPDVCGIDGVSVTGNGGFPTPFYGTSAAAPHVAAVCAQIWSVKPTLSNTVIRNLVRDTAVDLGPPGYDADSGRGRADALNALLGIDVTPPSVTIEQAADQPDPTIAPVIRFTVTFSEAVTGLGTGDVVLGGTAGAATAVVAGTGANYDVSVYGMTASGTVIATIPAHVCVDAGGNPNTASTSRDNLVNYDHSAALDCNLNAIDDPCDASCGEPGGPCDVSGCGRSPDCNRNGVPDECESDADRDGTIDGCDNCPTLPNGNQRDADDDGVGDVCDRCPETRPDVRANSLGCPLADADEDGDVDLNDFDAFQTCYNGPNRPPACE